VLDTMPVGRIIDIPRTSDGSIYGEWKRTADGWEAVGSGAEPAGTKRTSSFLDMSLAYFMTTYTPGPYLGGGVEADLIAWATFAAQLKAYRKAYLAQKPKGLDRELNTVVDLVPTAKATLLALRKRVGLN